MSATITDDLSEQLRATGLSASQIARACGVTTRQAQNWLGGTVLKPHARQRRRIEKLLTRAAETNGGDAAW
jgi:transcriptional regulator with XRE-family HTH domain